MCKDHTGIHSPALTSCIDKFWKYGFDRNTWEKRVRSNGKLGEKTCLLGVPGALLTSCIDVTRVQADPAAPIARDIKGARASARAGPVGRKSASGTGGRVKERVPRSDEPIAFLSHCERGPLARRALVRQANVCMAEHRAG
jgi:hypothetical protein